MNKDWDQTALSALRIHELRDLARKIGVKCPTALKKEELIEQSLQILNGETAPYVAPNKKGRPNKSDNKINNLIDVFLPSEINLDSEIKINDDDFNFYVSMPEVEYNADDLEEVEGLLEVTANGVGIIRVNNFSTSENDVYVHESVVVKNKLQSGDCVRAKVKTIIPNRPRAVTKIISVNSNLVKTNKTNRSVMFSNNNVLTGEIGLVLNQNAIDNAKTLFKNLNDNVNIYVSAFEREEFISTSNKIYAYVNPYKGYKDIFCCYNMAINRAIVLSKQNNVTVVLNSLSSYFRAIESMLCDKVDNQIKLLMYVKEHILKMFETVKKHNITLIMFDSLNVEPKIKEFLEFELSQVVDKFIK